MPLPSTVTRSTRPIVASATFAHASRSSARALASVSRISAASEAALLPFSPSSHMDGLPSPIQSASHSLAVCRSRSSAALILSPSPRSETRAPAWSRSHSAAIAWGCFRHLRSAPPTASDRRGSA